MSAIRSKDTTPEIVVRRIVHSMGFRFRLHVRALIGTPDIVLPRHRKIINVHGCFWHQHSCRRGRSAPKTNAEFWKTKRQRNSLRDREVRCKLRQEGWKLIDIWECQTHNRTELARRLRRFLVG
jgi:DNA mismatch endonuclease (patch repair protein)